MARKTQNKERAHHQGPVHYDLRNFEALTENQAKAEDLYDKGYHLVLSGYPGTGKTMFSTGLALLDLFDDRSPIEKIVIVRSAVQVREQGFVPGTLKEKQEIYEVPHIDTVNKLTGDDNAYAVLTKSKQLEFTTTSVQRSITIDNAVIIMDEAQNATYHELKTVLTRAGQNSRVIFCGDTGQNDLSQSRNRADISGFSKMMEVLATMPEFARIDFTVDDILRSELVRSFIIAEERFFNA